MVRGNWQKRVETADARRKENRQRKQKSDDKRHFKQWVQELQDLFGRNVDRLRSERTQWKLQLWTDTPPADEEDLESYDDNVVCSDAEERKKRSKSLGDILELATSRRIANGRGRSNSTVDPPEGKKKVHPRSKESNHDESPDDALPPLFLCRSFFFTGTCDHMASRGSGRKSGGCRLVHSRVAREPTLWSVLSGAAAGTLTQGNSRIIAELKRAERAETMAESLNRSAGAMEMVFYLEVRLDLVEDEGHESGIGEQITDMLLRKDLFMASIVYATLDNVLVFDRFRDGVLYPLDCDFLTAVLGADAVGKRRDAAASLSDDNAPLLQRIPGTILEHMLTFLPDSAVAVASRVCAAWRHEIGSPALYKHLLDRRDWPHPRSSETSLHDDANRDQFCQHYTVVRDMTAMQRGLEAILDPRTTGALRKEVAYQDFSARKHAPSNPNCCVGLQEWSPGRLLVAYHHDCSLRLFETHGDQICRELVCQRVDPYRHTKKRNCRIMSMGLDEQCVASLCRVTGSLGMADVEAFVLVVISRDDFLLGDSSGAADLAGSYSEDMTNVKVIDVGEAVLNYLVCLDMGDHRLLELIDFFSRGGDVGDVDVLASRTLASCGYGRFMVEASISIPFENDDGSASLRLIDRKLFLFSSTIGAIVWSGESNPLWQELRPRREDITLSHLRRPHVSGGSRASCFFAVGSATSPAIMVGEIEPSGSVEHVHMLDSSLTVRTEIMKVGWEVFQSSQRPLLVTPTDVVAADVLVRRDEEIVQERKSILSFYPRYQTSKDEPSHATMMLLGNIEVVRITGLRSHYVLLMCRQFSTPTPPPNEENEDVAPNAPQVHWVDNGDAPVQHRRVQNYAIDDSTPEIIKVTAVIVHVPSRREIGRVVLLNGQTPDDQLPHVVVDCNETVGLGLSWVGVVMTGSDVRMKSLDDDEHARAAKKKPQRRPTAKKKDGFARGKNRSKTM